MLKIDAYNFENFKKLREVKGELPNNGLFIIGGRNRQGKTSLVEAFAWMLGGAKFTPSTPKNEDAIGDLFGEIKLNNGLIVRRKGKNSSLEVVDPTGQRAGQTLLNSLVEELALDLPKFMNANGKEKAFILLNTLGIRQKLEDLDVQEQTLYDERLIIGREALSLRKHADEMPYYGDAPTEKLSAAAIITKQQEAIAHNNRNAEQLRELEKAEQHLRSMRRDAETIKSQFDLERVNFEKAKQAFSDATKTELEHYDVRIAKLTLELAKLQEEKTQYAETRNNMEISRNNEELELRERQEQGIMQKWAELSLAENSIFIQRNKAKNLPPDIDLSVFTADIEELEQKNAMLTANFDQNKVAKEAAEKEAEYDDYTNEIEQVRRDRMALLTSVKMPLPGLTIKDGALLYNNQRWDCMSGAEQLIVAASIVRAKKPDCGFVLMDKLEAMDLDSLEAFNQWCQAEDMQVIASRVSNGPECTIIIENGNIAE